MSKESKPTPTTITVPTSKLHVRGKNPNSMTPTQFDLLVRAIKKVGFLQPILVRDQEGKAGHFEVVDGAHRLKAAKKAGLSELPCVHAKDVGDDYAQALQIGMNRMRGDLDLGAVATSVVELRDDGWSTEDITVIGFSQDEITELLKLASTSASDALENADVSAPSPREPKPQEGPFVLEISFDSKDDLTRAKRALRKAGSGDGIAAGLLTLCDNV